jgi:beta-N-acetylhexosaminidase
MNATKTRSRSLVPFLGLVGALLWPGVPIASAATAIQQLVGQKLVVAMSGTTPSASLLGRARGGEIGGVILFGSNVGSAAAVRSLSAKLQAAAAAGGQPPLLIATDQEGGTIKRVPWAPPRLTVPRMGQLDDVATTTAQGSSAGYVLRCAGINDDLAPVADVPASTSSFMYQQGRTWSFSASVTASMSAAFGSGLVASGDVPAMKHFPGIGDATADTDSHVVTITASKTQLASGLAPYQRAIADGIPMIMLSNATYPAYDAANAAGWSHAIGTDLLRGQLGFTGVTMTDSLTGTAAARGVTPTSLAIKAAVAGTDLILVTGSESSTAATYTSLLDAANAGTIPHATLQASYDRILALKAGIAGPVGDATAPATTTPQPRLSASSTLGTSTVPVATSWSAKDACGISAYTVQRRTSGGTWTTQSLPSPTATSVSQSLSPGVAYGFVARATDGAGNTGPWAFSATVEPFVRESSSVVQFSGAWLSVSASGYSGGSTRYASAKGASATYTFTGTSVGWVAATGPTRGSAQVYIDGVYQATVSLYASTTSLRRIVFAWSASKQATHTIRVVVLGTAGHPRVDVDAFARLYRP